MSRYGVFSGPYFPIFGLNTDIYGVNLKFGRNTGKYGPEKTPYLDIFYTVKISPRILFLVVHIQTLNKKLKLIGGAIKSFSKIYWVMKIFLA